eukprot:m.103276 g.103276  ORF g.103276 m.103276 type:complete len:138 (+) comp13805_c0_seq2:256-669(+)
MVLWKCLLTSHAITRLLSGSLGIIDSFTSSGVPVVKFANGVKESIHFETWRVSLGVHRSVTRQQLPLQLAWAVSIHKSQGMSLDAVEIDLGHVFEYGQAYVALSRARSIQGLRVKRFQASCVKAHPQVLEFYKNLEH